MKRLKSIYLACKALGLSAICWAALAAEARAADGSAESGNYMVSYFLVLVGIAVGLAVVLYPNRRKERARPEKFGD